MASYEWLVEETSESLDLDGPVLFRDGRWRGWLERIELTPALRTYSWNLALSEPLRLAQRTDESPAWLFFNAAAAGGASFRCVEGFRFGFDPRRVLVMRPSLLEIESASVGRFSRALVIGVHVDHIEAAIGDELPRTLQVMARERIDVTATTELPATRSLRALVESVSLAPHRGHWRRFQLEHAALQFLGLVAGELSERKAPRPQRGVTHRERSAAYGVRDLLEERLADPPSLEGLARAAGMTPRRLNTVFRLLFGHAVFGLVQALRLEQARLALQRENVSVKQLAYRLGFSHPNNFIRAFTRHFGVPPGHFAASAGGKGEPQEPDGSK